MDVSLIFKKITKGDRGVMFLIRWLKEPNPSRRLNGRKRRLCVCLREEASGQVFGVFERQEGDSSDPCLIRSGELQKGENV